MATPLVWDHAPGDESQAMALTQACDIDPVIARLLVLRDITTPEAATRFLNPALDQLHDPFTLTDLPAAVDRLLGAIAGGERIAVHGDYDVDGVTSTVMLRRLLELLGGDIVHFIPDRIRDGYGLEPAAIERLAAQQVAVIVSVDCGIRSAAAAIRARELGVDLIITDHHEPDVTLPSALAVINPKRHDCRYPDKNLAGVGVALKVVQALCERTDHTRWLPGFIKLAALGTVADVVPLRGENRVIAKLGLAYLSQGRHTTGLRALLETTGLLGEAVTSFHVAFRLAPRINAAGRMSTPDLATRLLLLTDESQDAEARGLAEQLEAENLRRQHEEAEILTAARRKVDTDPDVGAHAILVVWGEGWHRGVIGIVASKLVDTYHRPAVVIAVDGDTAYGSGRSISRFDLLASLESCSDLFTKFGGHRHAAGLTMDADRLKALRRRLTDYADAKLGPDDLVPRLRIDGHLPLTAITPGVVEGLRAMEPFGAGNPRPVFHTGPVEVANGPRVMKSKHLLMSVRQEARVFRAVAWRMADRADFVSHHRSALDVAFHLTENHYRGEHTVELSVADVRQAD
ncbi:MAG: single-stranded-DNA-specific exonuclease RecJ [Acidobacteria bacterium]|nr:single-stranded-DNA-specific exonuclease RecJ [Acidobacteriota bacterium]